MHSRWKVYIKENKQPDHKKFPSAKSARLLLPPQKENQNASMQVACHANVTIHTEISIFTFMMEHIESRFW